MVCIFGVLSNERAPGSLFGLNPEYSWLWKEQGESEVSGWWRDAGKLNVGESTEFIIDK